MDDDYEQDETPCPKCGEDQVRWRHCDVLDCDDGYIDEHHDDPVNFGPGELYTTCHECCGTGVVRWCAACGCDITRLRSALENGEQQ